MNPTEAEPQEHIPSAHIAAVIDAGVRTFQTSTKQGPAVLPPCHDTASWDPWGETFSFLRLQNKDLLMTDCMLPFPDELI